MKHSKNLKFALFSGVAIATTPLFGAITYLDALEGSSGNTFATGGSLGDTTWRDPAGTGAQIEDQWDRRPFGNPVGSGSVFQAMHEIAISDDMPELTTQITGLADGTYTIWAFYWDQVTSTTQNWTISTGLTSGSLTTYSSPGQPAVAGAITTGVTSATALTFSGTAPLTTDTVNREMYGVNLGEVTVSSGAPTVNIFVDNLLGNGSLNRTWYDGVGYEQVIPEPSSSLLIALSGLALTLRRRR